MGQARRTKAVDALTASRRAASLRKQEAVILALKRMVEDGSTVSVAAVAREAGVTRGFVYSHEHLHMGVEHAMQAGSRDSRPGQRRPRATSVAEPGLRAELAQAHQVIKELREQVRVLRVQLDHHLGASLDAADHQRAADALSDKTREVDRLTAENQHLRRQVTSLERENQDLAEDLAAERRAGMRLATVSALPGEGES